MLERWSYRSINYRSKAVTISLCIHFLTSAAYTANIGTIKKIYCLSLCHRTKLELKISCTISVQKKRHNELSFYLEFESTNGMLEVESVIARLDQRVTLQSVCVITTPNDVASGNMTAIS